MRLQVPSLASLSGLRIPRCCELWCRPAATAPIRPLAWEPPCAVGVALEKAKRPKTKQNKTKQNKTKQKKECVLRSLDEDVEIWGQLSGSVRDEMNIPFAFLKETSKDLSGILGYV